ncbi:MAG: SBBP repeat-containing protein, partial [Planctomycetes bacterium]|nr:SBBP repeat-containing protein [Planctomycetota bacterium]
MARFALILLSLFTLSLTGFSNSLDAPSEGKAMTASFGKLPLYFIENHGQTDDSVAYYVKGSDKTLYFNSEGVTFSLFGKENDEVNRWAVKLNFVDANPDVKLRGEDKQQAVFSYFKGKKEDWKTGLPTFSKLVYEDLWPGIDLVYSGTVNKLKYEFVVEPGADPRMIQLAYEGASELRVKPTGELAVATPITCFEDAKPIAYQMKEGKQVDVSMHYSLSGGFENSYKFTIGGYDTSFPLILDPEMIIYCGYIGGNNIDGVHGLDIEVDKDCCAYIAGWTVSDETSFPVYIGPDIIYNGGDYDAFVAKVNAQGTSLIYCGYIGGDKRDRAFDIAVDSNGYAYITGSTDSNEGSFPVTVGPYLTYQGAQPGDEHGDAYVAKINADGSGLVYCGYIGGTYFDCGESIDVDADGNAYVVGTTASNNNPSVGKFPVHQGPDLSFNGGYDGFIAKLKAIPDESAPFWYCGYIGGQDGEGVSDIVIDSEGCAYITGVTASTQSLNFPLKVGPSLIHSGNDDVFVGKIINEPCNSDTLLNYFYCGYIGGSGCERSPSVDIDGEGNAYVAGYTSSDDLPVIVGPDLTYNGDGDINDNDAFVVKVNNIGDSIIYCGYIGGERYEQTGHVAVDSEGNAYVTGRTNSDESSFPVIHGPDLTFNVGSYDAFVVKVKADPCQPEPTDNFYYCGYIGGENQDIAYGIDIDLKDFVYIVGTTLSDEASFPVIIGPDLTHNGSSDVFICKIERYKHWYVDWDTPSINPDGLSWETAFPKIQDAIDIALRGDLIFVTGGTYNENVNFNGKAIMLKHGIKDDEIPPVNPPIIDPLGSGRGVTINGGAGENFGIDGFIIKNGFAADGGGIYCANTSPAGFPIIQNCLIVGNNAGAGDGGGIYCLDSEPTLFNITVYGNTATSNGGGVYFENAPATVTNTIVWNNTPDQIHVESGGNPVVNYCDVQGGWTGLNIDEDPMFANTTDPDNGGFKLTWVSTGTNTSLAPGTSPCINRGTDIDAPIDDIEGNDRPTMSMVCMGAYE